MRLFVFALAFLTLAPAAQADPLIDDKTCQYLVTHEPAADVEYTPGLDVHGKPVVEADLTPQAVTAPDNFSFDINVDVAQAAGIPVPPGTQALMKAGTVTYENGILKFNGKPLENEQETQLKALCRPPEKPSK